MKKLAAFLVLVLASAALAACGGSDDSSNTTTAGEGGQTGGGGAATKEETSGGGGGSTLSFEADPGGGLAYTTSEATAEAGQVTVDFNNPQALTHDVAIEGSNGEEVGKTELIAEGEDSTVVDLKPGTYTFYCSVPGHRESGMEGTLVVK